MNLQKMKNWLNYIIVLLLAAACKEENVKGPLGTDGSTPSQVSEVQVTNLPGKAKITYKLPVDPNLLYVKATYTLASGKTMEVKSSTYKDSLVVEGFADTLKHDIRLVTVSRAEIESAPLTVVVEPHTAPIWTIYKSMKIVNAFGGYKLTALNKTKAPIAILVMKRNVRNEWEVDNDLSEFTSTDLITSRRSGMDTLIHTFAIAVRDRWGNVTDTLIQNVKPFFEKEIPRSGFKSFVLPGDTPQVNGAHVEGAWDGNYDWCCGWSPWFTDINNTAILNVPSLVTIDIGVAAKISKVWIRPFKENSNLYYTFTTMKRFELYGSIGPNNNGALDGTWIKLGTYELKKPSGSSDNTETAADIAAAKAGFFYEADVNAPKIKYLRTRCIENFAGSCPQSIDELRIYGDDR